MKIERIQFPYIGTEFPAINRQGQATKKYITASDPDPRERSGTGYQNSKEKKRLTQDAEGEEISASESERADAENPTGIDLTV